jgi:site-specific DNA-methyltransferase (adenine-specific)
MYPSRLVETPVRAGSPDGGVVLDPFMGGGTTAVVARRSGRRYVGFEPNAKYIAIAEKRLRNTPVESRLFE